MLSIARQLRRFLNDLPQGGRVLVTTHRTADADAIASAAGLAFLITHIRPDLGIEILLPDKPRRDVRRLAAMLGIHTSGEIEIFDGVACVDVANVELLGEEVSELLSKAHSTLLVDHHLTPRRSVFKHAIVLEWPSSSEIVASLLSEFGIVPEESITNSLIVGILSDTKDLRLATAQTLKIMARLIEWGGSVHAAKLLLEREAGLSERIAVLKSATRAKLLKGGNLVVVVSRLSSYQARAADALIGLGADVAIVCGRNRSVTRVHMRASPRSESVHGINLVKDIVEPALKELGGHGGGHRLAAGLETAASANKALATIEKIIKNVMRKREIELHTLR